jgi:carboxypeptidase C (cathepsin A)
MLRNAMVKNPYMKVLVAAGYYDLATPYYAVEYTFNHMGLSPLMHKNITWDFYQSGHMLYIDSDSHTKLKHDVSDFIQSCLPKDIQ